LNSEIGLLKINFMIRCCIIFLVLLVSFFSIIGCSTGWEDTISRQARRAGSIPGIDSVVTRVMKKYDIPGISFAIAKNDSLLYEKGYGYADIPSKTEVTTNSLFRIGYLSEPITAMAVLRLIQEGKISMDEKVFGDSGILGTDFCKQPHDGLVKNITVEELLQHTTGWQFDDNILSLNHSLPSANYLGWILQTFPLEAIPGKSFHRSFINYLVLGKIIEKITGESYPKFVQTSILQPIGIADMQIAGTNKQDRIKNEVTHYVWTLWNHDYDEEPYEINISRMGEAAGWLGSARDLIKFMVRADGFKPAPDILDSLFLKTMVNPSQANPHFACGWWSNNNFENWFVTGDLLGSVCEMARASNGYCWVILTNKSPTGPGYEDALDRMVWEIINDSAIQWPTGKSFDKL